MHRRLIHEIRSSFPSLAAGICSSLCTGLTATLQAVLFGTIISRVFIEHKGLQAEEKEIGVLVFCIFARAAFTFASDFFLRLASVHAKSRLRERTLSHLITLGPAYLQRERSGELTETLYEGIEQLDPYLTRYIPAVAGSLFIPVLILGFVFMRDKLAALLLFVTMPLIPLFMILIGKMSEALAKRQWAHLSLLGAHFLDVIRGLVTLKLFDRSKAQIDTIERISDAYRKATMSTLRVAFLSGFVLDLLATLSTAMVAVAVGLRLLNGSETFQNGFIVLLLTPEFYLPFRNLGAEYHASMNGTQAADRLFEILDTKPLGVIAEECSSNKRAEQTVGNKAGVSISIENVSCSFCDSNSKNRVLAHISFNIAEGESIAVVGPSGAGKSTLLDLIIGFMKPDEGQIVVGNHIRLCEQSIAWWREQVAYVPQRPYLFHGTIMENLRYANPMCSLVDIREAAKKAGADGFVRSLKNGYDTMLGENGLRLSGGEVQRIALARAFLKNSPVFIFDEPTAHLDVESEFYIQQALVDLLRSRTAIIVAHRFGTISHVDRVVVLDSGQIVCTGRHDDLVKSNHVYKGLVHSYTGDFVS